LQPTEAAAEGWAETILSRLGPVAEYNAKCTPGYYNNELGANTSFVPRNAIFAGPPDEFLHILREWRENHGEERDLEITTQA
ncbi:MAG: hypothetical protein KUG65_08635, partial [Sphingomonadaceae bacterium]|nr:hypothetical protein [Sphingomonadaceae bacterium]